MVKSICIVAFGSKWQITNSGFNTSNPVKILTYITCFEFCRFFNSYTDFLVLEFIYNLFESYLFQVKIMLVTSSLTPGLCKFMLNTFNFNGIDSKAFK
jgi:hypothetical protein